MPDDVAGFVAGTACAVPAVVVETWDLCDRFVRSRMETIPMSAELRDFTHELVELVESAGWRHVDPEDVAGFVAGTACAVPAVVVGPAAGTVFGAPVAGGIAASRFVTVAAGKGLKFAPRISAGSGKQALGNVRYHASSVGARLRQKWGTLAFGGTAASTLLRKHMPDLYRKQKGFDALCGGPLPNLYVGSPWDRRLNPLIEVDHIRPRSRGGSDKLANLQLTHRTYNRAKGNLYGPALSRAKKHFCQYKP